MKMYLSVGIKLIFLYLGDRFNQEYFYGLRCPLKVWWGSVALQQHIYFDGKAFIKEIEPHAHMHTRTRTRPYTCARTHTHKHTYIHTRAQMCVCACMCQCVCLCFCVLLKPTLGLKLSIYCPKFFLFYSSTCDNHSHCQELGVDCMTSKVYLIKFQPFQIARIGIGIGISAN